jgi:hypothetical protein
MVTNREGLTLCQASAYVREGDHCGSPLLSLPFEILLQGEFFMNEGPGTMSS